MAVDARIVVWPKDHDINRVPKVFVVLFFVFKFFFLFIFFFLI